MMLKLFMVPFPRNYVYFYSLIQNALSDSVFEKCFAVSLVVLYLDSPLLNVSNA